MDFAVVELSSVSPCRIQFIERVGDPKNRYVLMFFQREQMRIARDNHIGFGRNGARDDMIIVRIGENGRRDRCGFHNDDDTLIALPQLSWREKGGRDGFRQLGIAQYFLEFVQQDRAGEEQEREGAGPENELMRRPLPQERRYDGVRVENETQRGP